MMYDYAMKSEPGGRPCNEDFIQMADRGQEQLFVLADGLGGMGNGTLASETAVRSVIGRFQWDMEPGFLSRAMETAQNAVLYEREKHPQTAGMSSTLTVLYLTQYSAQWAHIGDSRVYMFRKNRILYQTEDQSVPQLLVKMGEITPKQIRRHPDRNRLLCALGWEERNGGYVVSKPVKIRRGDAFLLCSDGFWEEIEEKEMLRERKKSDSAAQWLERMKSIVAYRGKERNMDNYSAICICVS